MLNIKEILKDPKGVEKKLKTKDPSISLAPVIDAYEALCKAKAHIEERQSHLNQISKEVGEKKRNGESAEALLQNVSSLKEEIHRLMHEFPEIENRYNALIADLPNIPDADIKVSLDPQDNVTVKTYKEKPLFSFPVKNHLELGESLGLFDLKRGAKITGAGWPIYTGMGARLEWALLNLMIETHVKNGFSFHLVPHLVRPEIMYGGGQLPKFADQLFRVHDKDFDLYLIPTSELALNGIYTDEILEEKELPKYLTCYSPCFRREAGAAGKKERGLIRIHQFNKVELFAFTTPEESDQAFEKMLQSASEVLEKLELHYRHSLLVTGDMSFGAARTLDIEVFLPGQDRYYEVSSVSNCRDFQSRRSKIRYKKEGKETTFVHTLNGSGLATPRLMVALLENNQQADGSVKLPKILHPLLGETLHPHEK